MKKLAVLGMVFVMTFSVFSGETYWNVKTSQPVVALTFDDGPDGNTLKLMEIFKKEGVKATFYVKGKNVKKAPGIVKKAFDAGHEIGNHTYTHPHLPKMTAEEVRKEIIDTQQAVKEATGSEPKTFRAPYLQQDEKVLTVLRELKMKSIMSSVGTNDWNKKETVASITDTATLKTKGGDIVLMHSWQKKTLDAMPEIIKRLKAKGLKFVTVSELLASEGK